MRAVRNLDPQKPEKNLKRELSLIETKLKIALNIAFTEVKTEIKRQDYNKVKTAQERCHFQSTNKRIHSFLEKKNISPLHPYYFFYLSKMLAHNKIINQEMYFCIATFKTLKYFQQPLSIFVGEYTRDLFIIYNAPSHLLSNKVYSISDFESEPEHVDNMFIITSDNLIYRSLHAFATDRESHPNGKPDRYYLQTTLTTDQIKNLLEEEHKIDLQTKIFLDELKQEKEFDKNINDIIQLHKSLKTIQDEIKKTKQLSQKYKHQGKNKSKNSEKKPKVEHPQAALLKEIRNYEKFSPMAYHKHMVALKKDLQAFALDKNTQKNMHKLEFLLSNYTRKCLEAFPKTNLSDMEDLDSKLTIEDLQVTYSDFIKNKNIEEKKALIAVLQNIMNVFHPLCESSFEQIQLAKNQAQQELEKAYQNIKNEFAAHHSAIFKKLQLLKTLYNDAEKKFPKKLKFLNIFNNDQFIVKYFGQLANLKKRVDRSSDKNIESIEQHIVTLNKIFKPIDDKIESLQKLLQPQKRRKKKSILRKNQNEDKKQDMITPAPPVSSISNHTIEILEETGNPNTCLQKKARKKRRKKKKKNAADISKQFPEKSVILNNMITSISPTNELTQNFESIVYEEHHSLEKSLTSSNSSIHDAKNNLFSASRRDTVSALTTTRISSSTKTSFIKSPSSLQHLSLFRSNSTFLSLDRLKNIEVDPTPYSYGLLMRCKNNKFLRPFAQKIHQQIKTFHPNKDLLVQPHISLLFLEDIQLNDETMRNNLIRDLEEIFSNSPLQENLNFHSLSAFGVGDNENKFLVIELAVDKQLNKIYERCLHLFQLYGFSVQKKYDFKPHITLGFSKIPLTQSQINLIDMNISQSYVTLDRAVLNRKKFFQEGVPNFLIPTQELQSFKLNIEETQNLRLNF